VKGFFGRPDHDLTRSMIPATNSTPSRTGDFANWVRRNVVAHKFPGYRAVYVPLKATTEPPGDITAEQMDVLADLADRYSFGEIRAVGDVLRDQLLYMSRCGINAFVVRADRDAKDALRVFDELTVRYQPGADGEGRIYRYR